MANAWVEFGGPKERLRLRLRSCDIILSDLDGTDTSSTGTREVLQYMTSHLFDEDLLRWLWRAGCAYVSDRNIDRSSLWHSFAERFLCTASEKERLCRWYTPTQAASLLYPGVADFYRCLHRAEKIYVTKAVHEIAIGFAQANNFDLVFADVHDKAYLTQYIVKQLPFRRRYLVKGDTHHDEAMLDVLSWHKRKKTIDDVIGINVCKDESRINPRFDINIGRDYRALVRALE